MIAFQSSSNYVDDFDFDKEYPVSDINSATPAGLVEVPIEIIPSSCSTNVLMKLVILQEILLEEERETFENASASSSLVIISSTF